MLPKDLIVGGNDLIGGEIWSNLALVPNYLNNDELKVLSALPYHQVHLQHLDLTRPSELPVDVAATWPMVRLAPLGNLLGELRIVKDPNNGGILWPAGAREYSARRTKTHVDPKTKIETKTWTGSIAELLQQKGIVSAFNAADLMVEQECRGLDCVELLVRLRYFDLAPAQAVLREGPYRHLLWKAGRPRPDHQHLCLILRVEEEKAFTYTPFALHF